MSADNDQGQAGHVRVEPHHGPLVERVVIHDRTGWHRAWRMTRLGLLIIIGLAVIALAAVWIWRKPIADDYIRDELARRGVQGSYTLDRVGFRTQQVSDLSIGDPANPDLTVDRATIQLRVRWNGSVEVYRVVARGVRLKGRMLRDGRVSWGQIDKLLPPPSGKPFTLPDLTVDLKDTTIALATPYVPMGFAVEGRGNLSGGFKGPDNTYAQTSMASGSRAWLVRGYVQPAADLSAFAYCSSQVDVASRAKTKELPDGGASGDRVNVKARCPRGSVVVGGGWVAVPDPDQSFNTSMRVV